MNKPKTTMLRGPDGTLNPHVLSNFMEEEGDKVEDIVLVAKMRDGTCQTLSSTTETWFLWAASALISDFALKSLNGEMEET